MSENSKEINQFIMEQMSHQSHHSHQPPHHHHPPPNIEHNIEETLDKVSEPEDPNMDPSKANKRITCINIEEKEDLVKLVNQHEILVNRSMMKGGNSRKACQARDLAWQDVTSKFNARLAPGRPIRTKEQLGDCYKNLRARINKDNKRYQAADLKQLFRTTEDGSNVFIETLVDPLDVSCESDLSFINGKRKHSVLDDFDGGEGDATAEDPENPRPDKVMKTRDSILDDSIRRQEEINEIRLRTCKILYNKAILDYKYSKYKYQRELEHLEEEHKYKMELLRVQRENASLQNDLTDGLE